MYCAGLDAHKQYTTIALLDTDTGEMTLHKRVANTAEAFAEVLAHLDGPVVGVVEAGRATWALYDRVHHLFDRLHVCDARQLHDRRPSRDTATTDARVAQDFARMVAAGNLPASLWVPDLDCRVNRAVVRGTHNLAEVTTKTINYLRSLCASFGCECPVSSLHLPRGKAWLAELQLPGEAQQMLEIYVQLLTELEAARAGADKIVAKKTKADPQVRRLRTVTGIGPYIALGLKAEIGDEKRFATGKALVGYAGLAPRVHQSGGKTRLGPLPKTGNRHLRYFAVLAAQHVANSTAQGSPLTRFYHRVAFRKGYNPAKVALARKLLVLAHHLLVRQEDYLPPPPQDTAGRG